MTPTASDGFTLDPRLTRASLYSSPQRRESDPTEREIRIYTSDPAASVLDGAVVRLPVEYEKLAPGPVGALFEVDNFDGTQHNRKADLDDPLVIMQAGYNPSPSDPRFHQQMVYAVASSVYRTFRRALGRHIEWNVTDDSGAAARLRLSPHGLPNVPDANYDQDAGGIKFGFYKAPPLVKGRNLPGSWVFLCLSHDVIAHEVTHALLDGLRSRFSEPTNPDVAGFHEGFADLVAVFQHFTFREVVKRGIAESRGAVSLSERLTGLAAQFGQTLDGPAQGSALRYAVQPGGKRLLYREDWDPHALGSVLVGAVFGAFLKVYERKAIRYVRLVTQGSGELPPGEPAPQLVEILAEQASRLAEQFLAMCIRAIDYCPPVDILFGEYLRALITADRAMVQKDDWGYREALVDSFRSFGIQPANVANLSEDSLLWHPPEVEFGPCVGLSFSQLCFQNDPFAPAERSELRRRAVELGRFITVPGRATWLGLMPPAEGVEAPCIHSVRLTRRVGPDDRIVFDLVAEVTQRRIVEGPTGSRFHFLGGSTLIFAPDGGIRYAIRKHIENDKRVLEQVRFMVSPHGKRLWAGSDGHVIPRTNMFARLHARS